MKFKDLYGLQFENVSFLEMPTGAFTKDEVDVTELISSRSHIDKLEIRRHFSYNVDMRRGNAIYSLWFESYPFMVICAAGRELEDYCARYITDVDRFRHVVKYLREISQKAISPDMRDVYDIEEWVPIAVFDFYGHRFNP